MASRNRVPLDVSRFAIRNQLNRHAPITHTARREKGAAALAARQTSVCAAAICPSPAFTCVFCASSRRRTQTCPTRAASQKQPLPRQAASARAAENSERAATEPAQVLQASNTHPRRRAARTFRPHDPRELLGRKYGRRATLHTWPPPRRRTTRETAASSKTSRIAPSQDSRPWRSSRPADRLRRRPLRPRPEALGRAPGLFRDQIVPDAPGAARSIDVGSGRRASSSTTASD